MIHYKLFIRLALSGLIIRHITAESKDDLYRYVGKLVLNSIERVDRIDYKEVQNETGTGPNGPAQ